LITRQNDASGCKRIVIDTTVRQEDEKGPERLFSVFLEMADVSMIFCIATFKRHDVTEQ